MISLGLLYFNYIMLFKVFLFVCVLMSLPIGVITTSGRRQPETLVLTMEVVSLETKFSIAFCRPPGDKWQLKTLFLATFGSCLRL